MEMTGTINEQGIVEEIDFKEDEIREIKFEQEQFKGTDGWGVIEVRYNEGGFYLKNVKWEIKDKFFHILEKGKEAEEGKYIPLSKLMHFSFYYNEPATGDEEPMENVDDNQKTEDDFDKHYKEVIQSES